MVSHGDEWLRDGGFQGGKRVAPDGMQPEYATAQLMTANRFRRSGASPESYNIENSNI